MSEDFPEKTRPWSWPQEWLHDEKFWRDVASRTFSGLIVAFIIWGVGIALGVFQSPNTVDWFINILQLLLAMGALISCAICLRLGISKGPFPRRAPPRWILLVTSLGMLYAAGLFVFDFINRVFLGSTESLLDPFP